MNGPGIERVIGAAVGRVVSMEAAPGIASNPDGATAVLNEVETARSQEYALLATLLAQAPDATLLRRLAELGGDATPLGNAHARLADAAAAHPAEEIAREYFELFIGVGRGELLPYGSYYLTGFLHERPLARLRADLQRMGIERADAQGEPEDHAAILCEIMAGLAAGKFPADPEHQRQFFDRHLRPWIERFFSDLETA
jgi:TorA maturation chaperone TorD